MSEEKKPWQQVSERFAALNKRERLLILAVVFLAPLVLFAELSYSPAGRQQRQIQQRYQDQLQSNSALQLQLTELALAAEKDPDADNCRELQQLQREMAAFEQQLQQHMAGVVSPQQMPLLLKAMLKKRPGLTLVVLENSVPEPINISASRQDEQQQAGGPQSDALLYRHPLHMEFRGSYLDTLDYVRSLQQLPGRLFWHGLDIQMSDHYPEALIKMDVYTLSLQKGWISG
ncbi:MAG: hypothetical protein J7K75_05005 [Desulfuromonas sp.]|nr:hypothetical protein [Desulfuromonas sp.]